MPENVKGSIRDLSSAIGTVAGGLSGGSLSNAQIAGVLGQNAVENNALINSKGEGKLNAQERKINEKLKKQAYKVRMITKENTMHVKPKNVDNR